MSLDNDAPRSAQAPAFFEISDATQLLNRLRTATDSLIPLSRMCLIVTLMNVAFAFFSVASIRIIVRLNDQGILLLSAIVGTLVIAAVIVLFNFDQRRKSGDAIFQELSDELEWSPHQTYSLASPPTRSYDGANELPRATVRLAVREYLLASALPFASREGGVRSYLAVNVTLSFGLLVLLALRLL